MVAGKNECVSLQADDYAVFEHGTIAQKTNFLIHYF
jgi:hypothetical protein